MNPLPDVLQTRLTELLELADPSQEIYLVGGAIRNLLLGQPFKDLDFIVTKDGLNLARKVADKNHGAFYLLDGQRGICRVLLGRGDNRIVLDFAAFQGNTLEDDLQNRDFTFNALAIDLRSPQKFIDPLRGAQDLVDKIVRLCSPYSIERDPVRMLRALRFATELGGKLDKGVVDAIKANSRALRTVSGERKREELYKLLSLPNSSAALRAGQYLGIFEKFLEITDSSISQMQHLEYLVNFLMDRETDSPEENLLRANLALHLNPLKGHLKRYLKAQFVMGVERYAQLLLAGLNVSDQQLNRLALSNDEQKYFQHTKIGFERMNRLLESAKPPGRIQVHRYFKRIRESGIDGALLSIINLNHSQANGVGMREVNQGMDMAAEVLNAWFNKYDEIVEPKRILDGEDVKELLGIGPGPELGKILNTLEEMQVEGKIKSRDEAIAACKSLEI